MSVLSILHGQSQRRSAPCDTSSELCISWKKNYGRVEKVNLEKQLCIICRESTSRSTRGLKHYGIVAFTALRSIDRTKDRIVKQGMKYTFPGSTCST